MTKSTLSHKNSPVLLSYKFKRHHEIKLLASICSFVTVWFFWLCIYPTRQYKFGLFPFLSFLTDLNLSRNIKSENNLNLSVFARRKRIKHNPKYARYKQLKLCFLKFYSSLLASLCSLITLWVIYFYLSLARMHMCVLMRLFSGTFLYSRVKLKSLLLLDFTFCSVRKAGPCISVMSHQGVRNPVSLKRSQCCSHKPVKQTRHL